MAHVNIPNQEQLGALSTLTEIQKLQTNRAYRVKSGKFYIEGVRNFIKAVDNRFTISTIIYSEKLLTAPLARKLVRTKRRDGILTINITPEQFRRISSTERASGIGAIVQQQWSNLKDISPGSLYWVVLETVRSPGNLGTLIRTSEAFGGAGFIFIGNKIDPFDPDVVRASMSSLFSQKFVRTFYNELSHWLQHQNCTAIGASPDGSIDLHQFKYNPSTLLFLGEERQGLTQQQRELCQQLVRIPMTGAVDSLNLAVAGSLMMYEVYRSQKLNV